MIKTIADFLHFVADHAAFHAESDLIAAHEAIDLQFPPTETPVTTGSTFPLV